MAKVTFVVEGKSVGTHSFPWQMSEEDSTRLLAFVLAAYPKKNEDGSLAAPDPLYSIEAYLAGVVAGTMANVERYEREVAAETARADVAPVVAEKVAS